MNFLNVDIELTSPAITKAWSDLHVVQPGSPIISKFQSSPVRDQLKSTWLQDRSPYFSVVILLCLSAILWGCDGDSLPVVPTITSVSSAIVPVATAAPTVSLENAKLDSNAAKLLIQAANVSGGLHSYRSTFGQLVVEVVAPDRCRFLDSRGGSLVDALVIGNYLYQGQPGTDLYVQSYFPGLADQVACAGDRLPSFRDDVSRLTEASVIGNELIEGHKVVHIRYTHSPHLAPFPTGSGADSVPYSEVWLEEQTARVLKLMPTVDEPEAIFMFSRFDEPVTPPIERPDNVVVATPLPPTPVPTALP